MPSATSIHDDPRRLIARLATATLVADGQVALAEIEALRVLDGLGLGRFAPIVREEIERASAEPIDVSATCAALGSLPPESAAVIFGTLAELVAADHEVSKGELETLRLIAAAFDLPLDRAQSILDSVLRSTGTAQRTPPPPPAEPPQPSSPAPRAPQPEPAMAAALRALQLEAPVDRDRLDAAYLALVARLDPARIADLGADFAALAARKLGEVTRAYDVARGVLDEEAAAGTEPR